MSLRESLRQLLYPKSIRIAPPLWPEASWPALQQMAAALVRASKGVEPAREGDAVTPPSDATIAQLATGLWRLRQKMVQPGTDQPVEEMRKAFRHLQSTWDVLVGAGVQIQDHTNSPFSAGLSLKVVTYQPMPGLSKEEVIETVKPSVYYQRRTIQVGEVIVGTPESLHPQRNN
jgi:hypothetical protein